MTSAPAPAGAPPAPTLKHSPWLVLFTLCLGFFMILLDTTIVNIAIPNIDRQSRRAARPDPVDPQRLHPRLRRPADHGGRLGDLYGPKRLFIIGLAVFTVASAACGLAQNPGQLIVVPDHAGPRRRAAHPADPVGPDDDLPAGQARRRVRHLGRGRRCRHHRRADAGRLAGHQLGLALDLLRQRPGRHRSRWCWRADLCRTCKLNRRHRLDIVGTALATAGLFLHLLRPDRRAVARLGHGLGSDHDPRDHRRRRRACWRSSSASSTPSATASRWSRSASSPTATSR